MATKSVIEIDVLDEKFKAFSKELEKVVKSLEEQKKILNETSTAKQVFSEKFKSSLNDIEKKVKSINPGLKDMNSNLSRIHLAFKGIGSVVGTIVEGVIKIGRYLAFGALAGGAALFGIATNASNVRRTALGYGINEGQLRAARGVYGTYAPNIEQSLGNLSKMQQTPEDWGKLAQLGIGVNDNVGESLPKLLENIVGIYKRSGGNVSMLQATGALDIFDLTTIRSLANLKEFPQLSKQYLEKSKQYGNQDATYASWQKFKQTLDVLTQTLQDKLIVKLLNLKDPLEKVVNVLADIGFTLIDSFGKYLSTPQFKKDSEQFAQNLKELASVTKGFLSGSSFQEILTNFGEALTKFSYVMDWIAKLLGYENKKTKEERIYKENFGSTSSPYSKTYQEAMMNGNWHDISHDQRLKQLSFLEDKRYGLPNGTIWATIGQESRYGKSEPLGVKTTAGWRALGYGQFSPYTARSLGLKNPWNANEVIGVIGKVYEDNRRTLKNWLLREPTNDELVAAYNSNPQAVYKALVKSGFDDKGFLKYMPKQTQIYVPAVNTIRIHDNTENSSIHSTVTLDPSSLVPTPAFAGF